MGREPTCAAERKLVEQVESTRVAKLVERVKIQFVLPKGS